jgi:hypothetical protein
VWTVGSTKTRGKTRDAENVRAVPRLAAAKATGAYARQSALGLLLLGGDSRNREERRVSWLTDAATKYHSENARLFFDGIDRRGLGGELIGGQPTGFPPRGFPLSEWK